LPGIFLLIFWRAVLTALSANLLNLLDLRPGRSIKSFLMLSFIYIWRVPGDAGILLLFPFWLASLVYLPWDLQGKGMLGDAGANVLGGVLGLAIVLTAPAAFQIGYMAVLVGIHVLAERVSFTKLISANYFLRFLDTLGREGWEK
jgi:UDP-N-acetylmuramyl pentapeptide phosphotransferase/UDP-N-acetylglucosamine-1-phosphate transferase